MAGCCGSCCRPSSSCVAALGVLMRAEEGSAALAPVDADARLAASRFSDDDSDDDVDEVGRSPSCSDSTLAGSTSFGGELVAAPCS